jgi:hypothetical protein
MEPDHLPRRRPRPIWPALGVIAAIVRILIDAWRLFYEN